MPELALMLSRAVGEMCGPPNRRAGVTVRPPNAGWPQD